MTQGLDGSGRTERPSHRPALARDSVRYTLAVLGYIALILLTKEFLTFTWGVCYFVVVLEVLPRFVSRISDRGNDMSRAATSEMTGS